MRGVSRTSLAAVQDRLEPVLTTATAARTVGGELLAVVDVLDATPALRAALTDPARGGDAKAQLVTRVLGGQVGGTALDVVSSAVRERWATPRDLADALEALGTQALLASAQQDGALDGVEDEIFRFSRVVSGEPDLARALGDWRAAPAARTGLAQRLLGDRVHPVTLALVLQAVRSPRGRRLDATLHDVLELAAARRQRLVAVVTAAVPLSEAQQARLATALHRVYGRQVLVEVDVDTEVLGGLRVAVGDEVLDATVLSRMSEAERRLSAPR